MALTRLKYGLQQCYIVDSDNAISPKDQSLHTNVQRSLQN